MSLDIIIPTLNEYQNLKILLPYLKQHISNSDTKIIVVDAQKSTDDTAQLCRLHDIMYLKSAYNQRASQMNEGALQTTADHLIFIHADVLPPATFVPDILSALSDKYDFGLFPYTLDSPSFMLKINSWFTNFHMLMAGGGDQCHFMTKTCYTALGGYDSSYNLMEDFDFFDRIKASEYQYTIVPSKAIVSARKYDKYSWFRVNLVNLIVFTKYRMGVEPDRLKAFCNRWLA